MTERASADSRPSFGQFEALKLAAAGLLFEDARGYYIECRPGDPRNYGEKPELFYFSRSINGMTTRALIFRGWVKADYSRRDQSWRSPVVLTFVGQQAYTRERTRQEAVRARKAALVKTQRTSIVEAIKRRRERLKGGAG